MSRTPVTWYRKQRWPFGTKSISTTRANPSPPGPAASRSTKQKCFSARNPVRTAWSDEVVDLLEIERMENADRLDARKDHLRECLRSLPSKNAELVHDYYFNELSVEELGKRFERSIDAIYKTLQRVPPNPACLHRKQNSIGGQIMKEKELRNLIDGHLWENLDLAGAKKLSDHLSENADARKLYLEMTDLHASLAVDETMWIEQPEWVEKEEAETITSFRTYIPWALAASVVFLLSLLFWPKQQENQTFALIKDSYSATWEGGDLTTAVGSRLGDGTLRLTEGLVTLQFDSGAEVTLEAPVSLRLVDSMKCELTNGTAVTYVPESALGFRIITPEADVVDYGTRFSVTVFEETGETHTRVMEGKVQIEYSQTGEIVALSAGERHTVKGDGFAIPPAETFRELGTIAGQTFAARSRMDFFRVLQGCLCRKNPKPSVRHR